MPVIIALAKVLSNIIWWLVVETLGIDLIEFHYSMEMIVMINCILIIYFCGLNICLTSYHIYCVLKEKE